MCARLSGQWIRGGQLRPWIMNQTGDGRLQTHTESRVECILPKITLRMAVAGYGPLGRRRIAAEVSRPISLLALPFPRGRTQALLLKQTRSHHVMGVIRLTSPQKGQVTSLTAPVLSQPPQVPMVMPLHLYNQPPLLSQEKPDLEMQTAKIMHVQIPFQPSVQLR